MTDGGRRKVALLLAAALLVAWCGWVSGYHRATFPARLTWAASLATVVVVDVLFWRGRRRRRFGLRLEPSSAWPPQPVGGWQVLAGTSPWLVLVLAAAAWDVLGLDTGARQAHLTISALTQSFRPLDAATLLVWMVVGFGYGAAKARAPERPRVARRAPRARAPGSGASTAAGTVAAFRFGHLGVPHGLAGPALLLPSSRPLGVGFWLAVVVAAVAIDQLARRSAGRVANAEELMRLVTGPPAANLLLVLAWAYAGYHLFAH